MNPSNSISFEDGLKLVSIRANAMQKACQNTQGTMAAILGLPDDIIESTCNDVDGIVKPANYNCPGQLVISGEIKAVEKACEILKEKGAKRADLIAKNNIKVTIKRLEQFGSIKSNLLGTFNFNFFAVYFSTLGSIFANVPTAPDIAQTEIFFSASNNLSYERLNSKYLLSILSPNVVGSAYIPWLLPIHGVLL